MSSRMHIVSPSPCLSLVLVVSWRGLRAFPLSDTTPELLARKLNKSGRRVLVRRLLPFLKSLQATQLLSESANMREVISIHIGQAGIQVRRAGRLCQAQLIFPCIVHCIYSSLHCRQEISPLRCRLYNSAACLLSQLTTPFTDSGGKRLLGAVLPRAR